MNGKGAKFSVLYLKMGGFLGSFKMKKEKISIG